jgi:sugar O-acyltransferase (sialic acid O-acetyltransferase NeuD family)
MPTATSSTLNQTSCQAARTPASFYRRFGKRIVDVAVALSALLAMAPLLALIALAVRWRLGPTVIYRQRRGGLGGTIFEVYKFRTMTDARDEAGRLLPDAQRLTPFGRWLRRSSLDELPQLWNVVRGEMSLVGPRPLLSDYLPRYSPRQSRRHEVRPGLTGWAQVSGRNGLPWEERLECDVRYVDHVSFALDMKIAALTVLRVLSGGGVSAQGHATMPEFTGSSAPVCIADTTDFPAASDRCGDRRVHVIGAGGHAKVVIASLESAGWMIDGLYDDDPALWNARVLGHRVAGPVSRLASRAGLSAVIAVGDPATREQIARRLPLRWITAVHSAAMVHASVQLGEGSVVFAGAIVQPDAVIGRHVVVNTGASIDHDGRIGDFANIGPGARLAGGVCIGERCDIGTGSVVIPQVEIGDDSVLGAGSVAIRSLEEGVVAVGAPARVIRLAHRNAFRAGRLAG